MRFDGKHICRWLLLGMGLVMWLMHGPLGSPLHALAPQPPVVPLVPEPETRAESDDEELFGSPLGFAAPAPVSGPVQAIASRSKVQVAEPFTVTLTVKVPAGTNVTLPQVGSQLGEFDVIDHRDVRDLPVENGERQWVRTLTLESIVTGELAIPPLEVYLRSGEDERTVRSQPIRIEVASVLEDRADPTQFRDIRSVVDLPTTPEPERSAKWLWWIGGGSAAALALMGLIWIARRQPRIAPATWAKRQLETLSKEIQGNSTRQEDAAVVAGELSSILGDYLRSQLQLDNRSQTTAEWIDMLEHRRLLNNEELSRFQSLSESAELVKFAGVPRSRSELAADIELARQLIDRVSLVTSDRDHDQGDHDQGRSG